MTHARRVAAFLVGSLVLGAWVVSAGPLDPPTGPVAPTYRTLDQVMPTWDRVLPTPERFQLVMGGAGVLDLETGLVWERSPDTTLITGNAAVEGSYNKTVGGRKGWRLPSAEEFMTLIDATQTNPALPAGHPFTPMGPSPHQSIWTSTISHLDANRVWHVDIVNGRVAFSGSMLNVGQVWLVRGGRNHEPMP